MSADQNTQKRSYKQTLNLPKTSFSMKANLVQREPEFQARWAKMDLYQRMLAEPLPEKSGGEFVLHDGPPYANGAIHLGHLLNKVLKDLVVRSRFMLGYRTPFVPGWDCHGLPIEHKVMKDLGPKAREMSVGQIRHRCQQDAEKFINLQRKQMQRLGTVGDYENPYLTMRPEFEAATLEVFADMVEAGLVYRDLKPVHWSIANCTALADAELEYEDREDTSVYVLFEVANPEALPGALMARPGEPINLMIWTTTPWTLPANLAVAAAPAAQYTLYRFHVGTTSGMTLMASALAEKVFAMAGASYDALGTATGAELEAAGVKYRHPFIDRVSPLVTADYVTLEDGTGLVHTAPGHGVEDYHTGLKYGLNIYCPVQEDGTFDATAPDFLQGVDVWQGNGMVVDKLRESGHLFHDHKFMHSYPHDWRSKTPTIFRATEQWFISVDRKIKLPVDPPEVAPKSLRARSIDVVLDSDRMSDESGWDLSVARNEAPEEPRHFAEVTYKSRLHKVRFLPDWGRNRMRGMLESRPDWCISRQRAWGLPIPAFFGPRKGEVLLTPASVRAVADKVRAHGSDFWFKAEPAELLADYDMNDAPDWLKAQGLPSLRKGADIFDVWFESGSSWNAVLRQRGLKFPADLYLEGSDQHRGWFQTSLLPSLGVTGKPPFNAVLTHGFMVDKNGKKMSKSEGNAIEVEALLKDLGADVCRWWVASLNTDNDIKADMEFFRLAGEEYRKVRNTIRFLLSNLYDFDPQNDRVEVNAASAHTVDAWAQSELAELITTVRAAYEGYQFRRALQAIFDFCNDTLSAVYLAATKDRLYCDGPGWDRRRRTQTVMFDIAQSLIRLVAPILVHTADEAWLALTGMGMESELCVHLQRLPGAGAVKSEASAAWPTAMALRDRALKKLEASRGTHDIDNPLDAGIRVGLPPEVHSALKPFEAEMADLCGVSRLTMEPDNSEIISIDDLRTQPRCERSWKRDGTVKQRSDGGMLTDRDARAVGVD